MINIDLITESLEMIFNEHIECNPNDSKFEYHIEFDGFEGVVCVKGIVWIYKDEITDITFKTAYIQFEDFTAILPEKYTDDWKKHFTNYIH